MNCIYPVKIVMQEGVENAEALLNKKALQIGLGERNLAVFKGKAYVVLDFGKETSGGARILTFHASNGRVRIRFGESVSEACAELGGKKNATNDHSLRDICVELQNYSDMTFGQSGFRFIRIDSLSEDAELQIKSVVVRCDMDTREELGSFTCDDALVNDIWNTAAYTLRLCLQNGYFWDGVKRDRLVWIGDLYPEMRTAHCLFGDVPETVNSLDFAMEETPLPKWMAGMPAYSLWWLIILRDEYRVNGDKNAFVKYLPYIKALVKQVSEHVSESGETTYPSNFIDWPSTWVEGEPSEKKTEVLAGMSYLTKIAMEKTAEFLKEYEEDVSLCEDILARLAKKTYVVRDYKQIAAIGVWAGDRSENNKETLLRGGAKGLSTFMSYPILTAIGEYGEYETALNMMKEYYGGMLSVGATTFWEDFDLEWLKNASRIDELPKEGQVDIHGDYGAFCYIGFRHSFCHGWSAGVIPYLMETVVGAKTVGAGMRRITIQPHMSGLKHIRATLPTPYGVVKIEHTLQENGEVKTSVSAPEGVEVKIVK